MFHEDEKQNLSKTLVRYELFLCFPGGYVTIVSRFDFFGKNSTKKRFELRRGKACKSIRLSINKRDRIPDFYSWFWSFIIHFQTTADSESVDHRQQHC